MRILVLTGSPQPHGSTNLLTEHFARGAREAGHTVEIIDTARLKLHPCTGCVVCGYDGPCVQHDDMAQVKAAVLAADMLALATPLYYYGISAQLKTVIDRFCAFNGGIQRKRMKSALLAVAWNSDDWTMTALTAHYHTLVRYLNWQDQGMVLGLGCGTPDMTRESEYPEQAWRFGKNL